MKRRIVPQSTARSAAAPRPGLPVLMLGAALLWTAHVYCQGGGQGLVVLAAVAVGLAVAIRRSLPPTARSMIWSYLAAAVLCMAANIERVGARDLGAAGATAYPFDRAATLVFAVGVATLFFRPSRSNVTILGVAIMPMLAVMQERLRLLAGGSTGMMEAGAALALVVLAAQCQEATRPRAPTLSPPGVREWSLRLLLPAGWIALSLLLAPAVASMAETTRDLLYELAGFSPPSQTSQAWRASTLSVASPPKDNAGRIRILMDIDAPRGPGYLRESVYRSYGMRHWSGQASATAAPLRLESGSDGGWRDGQAAYWHGGEGGAVPGEAWTFRPLGRTRLADLCLPGSARVVVVPEDAEPLASVDGVISIRNSEGPFGYEVRVEGPAPDAAFAGPDPSGLPEYRDIPWRLVSSVSNWVAGCAGLAEASGAPEAVSAVTRHFRQNFVYELGRGEGAGEPLEAFMAERTGHCTLFASAAVLMLRQRGVPTRMVSGYYCGERHPHTGRWVVRERNAHAWCEAWDAAARRWMLVEATPPGGLPDSLPQPGRLRLFWERIVDGWRQFVERIRETNPLIAIADYLATLFSRIWAVLPALRVVLPVAIGAGLLLWRRRRRRRAPRDEETRLRGELVRTMEALERKWSTSSQRRAATEPWADWARRIATAPPQDVARQRLDLIEEYQSLRYADPLDAGRARAWLAATHSKANTPRA